MKKTTVFSIIPAVLFILFFLESLQAEPVSRDLVNRLLMEGGVQRGICSVLGVDEDLPLQMAEREGLLIHVLDSDGNRVHELRKSAARSGFGISRLVAERSNFESLPYADNLVDLVISSRADTAFLKRVSPEEIMRILRPKGIALIGLRDSAKNDLKVFESLRSWAGDSGDLIQNTLAGVSGNWIKLQKPAMVGADDWSHWEKSPDNNPVSKDQIIKAPYMTQFMANPLYIGMPSITTAAGGRTFLAIGHIAHHAREWDGLLRIIARNGYNGTVLWERDLPEGYLVHRSAFIATPDVYHMIEGDHCLKLDAETGKELGSIRIPELDGDWKWMAMHQGVLYVLAGSKEPGSQTMKGDRAFGGWSWADLSKGYYGKQVPYGFGDTLAAFDLKHQVTLWVHHEESLIDSRGMAIQGDQIYIYSPDNFLRSLDHRSGDILWTNEEASVLGLIEQPGRRLTSTPGFKTACLTVATPDALIIQGQTRMNVIAVSTQDGNLLWSKKKITNNPNAIYVDGRVVLGVGERGSHVAVDPLSGEIMENLKFFKRACTRLTASSDSFFCRGEGTLRYDRALKKVFIDGAARPACNDGALPANGMLYIGPWQCDCNLSLIGHIGKCSAGDFRFDYPARDEDRLETDNLDSDSNEIMTLSNLDWSTYRANNDRSSSTKVKLTFPMKYNWEFQPDRSYLPTGSTSAGNLVFSAGDDGAIRALDTDTGQLKWQYLTPAPIKYPPTLWNGLAYAGGGDGYIYCLHAHTGELAWRFRAAPVDRHIMVYDRLSSTWPVHSGVLVHEGIAYAAAGIIDHDGTYVYALDARTGKLIWENNSSGHLNSELRKGVSVQGNLSIQGHHLLLAGGNQISPARYDLKTGECKVSPFKQGQPKANNGKFLGVFENDIVLAGGRILHSSPRNVATKGSFDAFQEGQKKRFLYGGIPPAWDEDSLVYVNFKFGKLTSLSSDAVTTQISGGSSKTADRGRRFSSLVSTIESKGGLNWDTDLDGAHKFEVISLGVASNSVLAVAQFQAPTRSQSQWWLMAIDKKNGRTLDRKELNGEPFPGGLLINRHGQIMITMLNGNQVCIGPAE